MDEATKSRVFEPFYTTKEVGKGTGLGLATVFSIVQQHDGWIEVDSAPCQGATFRIYLPETERRQEEEGSGEAGQTVVKGGNESLLIVEDETAVRRLLVSVLRRLGYRVHDVQNGAEAIEWLKNSGTEIDLLVTDSVMPGGVSGVELTERARTLRPGVRLIMMSGYSAELIDHGLPALEGVRFIGKPFEVEDFTRLVRECLDGEVSEPRTGA